jgi:RNA ligase
MMIDLAPLRALVADGLLTCRSHQSAPLLIWNYTAKAAYNRIWNEHTMMCRGLITTTEGLIVARPFPKFFNVEEWTGALAKEIPAEPFEVYEKLDGSLGIVFNYDGRWMISTRGSFESDQAIEGAAILAEIDTSRLDTSCTYLTEIIY